MSRMEEKIEILAPAGSYDSFVAAINAGADAVYAGGMRFGARAYADNFTSQQLLDAVDYAHLHKKRLYLTVNTLLKDSEMKELYAYLKPLYCQGLDAVIVQDAGVLSFVRAYFPDLEIHASTQMTITNVYGAQYLKEYGVKRVVPARELSLAEIRRIRSETKMDVECFVHGALCYCYSGQCLLSSFIGGRSGNRGQCAQPCRLPYTAKEKKGYLLSLKDICTLELLPEMAEAGINSFKIEGRMKKPEYVAAVTAMYRKYLDMYYEKGKAGYKVDQADLEQLKDIYNRGGFHTGYYKKHNGREMLALDRPNHAGVPAVKILVQKGREVTAEALTDIHRGDILELTKERDNYTFGKEFHKKQKVSFLVPKHTYYKKGTILNRIRNQALLDELDKKYVFSKKQEKIHGLFRLLKGKPAVFILTMKDVCVQAQTEACVQKAQTRPLEREEIEAQLRKTGNTPFEFETLEIEMEEGAFLPMQQIKQIRRDALEQLEKEVCQIYRRKMKVKEVMADTPLAARKKEAQINKENLYPLFSVLVESKEQLLALEEFFKGEAQRQEKSRLFRVYLDVGISGGLMPSKEIRAVCENLQCKNIEVFYALPHIFREEAAVRLKEAYSEFYAAGMDGVLVRNYEEIQFLKEQRFDKQVILDHNLYVFNQSGKHFFQAQGLREFTAPLELNAKELAQLGIENAELIIYGHLPVMISAQCITKTVQKCRGESGICMLTDRYQNQFPVKNYCSLCYNVMYNTSALYLADYTETIEKLAPKSVRLQFTVERKEQTLEILKQADLHLAGKRTADTSQSAYTRGHFKRGII